jgi:arabinan endo-1,5-alpha-L-arabinosidase
MFILLVSLMMTLGCEKTSNPVKQTEDTLAYYTNPVFEPTFADPTVIKADDDYYYAYATEDFWEGKDHLVAVIRSKDLVKWSYLGDAFAKKPAWKQGGLWAPNVFRYEGKYFMFYSLSIWGDTNPGVGLASSELPQGPFTDQGKFFLSSEVGVSNSIDPCFFQDPVSGNLYIFWGSFRGIYGRQLQYSEGTFTFSGEKFQIAGNQYEGSYLYYKDGFYYYFGSCGSCCDGINSTYHVRVGRSENIQGPYIDPSTHSLLETAGEPGKLVIKGNGSMDGFAGPGHNGEIFQDGEGNYWFLYHAIEKKYPNLGNGATRRPLMLDRLTWYEGWPMIEYSEPSMIKREVPAMHSMMLINMN